LGGSRNRYVFPNPGGASAPDAVFKDSQKRGDLCTERSDLIDALFRGLFSQRFRKSRQKGEGGSLFSDARVSVPRRGNRRLETFRQKFLIPKKRKSRIPEGLSLTGRFVSKIWGPSSENEDRRSVWEEEENRQGRHGESLKDLKFSGGGGKFTKKQENYS